MSTINIHLPTFDIRHLFNYQIRAEVEIDPLIQLPFLPNLRELHHAQAYFTEATAPALRQRLITLQRSEESHIQRTLADLEARQQYLIQQVNDNVKALYQLRKVAVFLVAPLAIASFSSLESNMRYALPSSFVVACASIIAIHHLTITIYKEAVSLGIQIATTRASAEAVITQALAIRHFERELNLGIAHERALLLPASPESCPALETLELRASFLNGTRQTHTLSRRNHLLSSWNRAQTAI